MQQMLPADCDRVEVGRWWTVVVRERPPRSPALLHPDPLLSSLERSSRCDSDRREFESIRRSEWPPCPNLVIESAFVINDH